MWYDPTVKIFTLKFSIRLSSDHFGGKIRSSQLLKIRQVSRSRRTQVQKARKIAQVQFSTKVNCNSQPLPRGYGHNQKVHSNYNIAQCILVYQHLTLSTSESIHHYRNYCSTLNHAPKKIYGYKALYMKQSTWNV